MVWRKGGFWKSRARRLAKWKLWYAWRPVTATGTDIAVWLETIERRRIEHAGTDFVYSEWEYRRIYPIGVVEELN